MDWTPIKNTLATIAPAIGTVLGGPLGGAAGAALASVLGVNATDAQDPVKVGQALGLATPEQLLALKQADLDFQAKMAQLGYENVQALSKIAADDRQSARSMQMSTRSVTPTMLAIVVTLGFFGVLTFMLIQPIPAASRDVLNILLGSLGTAWTAIIMFFFGSSAGSDKKTDILAKAQPVDTNG